MEWLYLTLTFKLIMYYNINLYNYTVIGCIILLIQATLLEGLYSLKTIRKYGIL